MKNTIIDNSANLHLVDTLKELISNADCKQIQIASGYWDMPGMALLYDELKAFFERGGRMQLLIGKEPQLRAYQLRPEPVREEKFPDFCIKRDIDLLTDEYKPVMQLVLDYSESEDTDIPFEIRVYGQRDGEEEKFLHSKCYIIYHNEKDGSLKEAYGIIGSSNFTAKGLQDNAELNYLETDVHRVAGNIIGQYKTHKSWFEEMWADSELWNGEFIRDILKPSPIGRKIEVERHQATSDILTPYEVYIKYLQLQFGDMVDANTTEVIKTYLPESFNTLEYQMDAVKQCYSVMRRYGGFLLGDVVGLGKTVVGVLLIRYFLENAASLSRAPKVLIIAPPAIKSAWVKTIAQFDKNTHNNIGLSVDYVTTGSIDKLLDDDEIEAVAEQYDDSDEIDDIRKDNYGLILIDESHNFRNSNTHKYRAVDDLIGSISPTPYVALLSATPQNNSPKDIYNQIRLFQRNPNNSNLPGVEGGKLDTFFNAMEKKFDVARKIPQNTDVGRAKARIAIAEISEQIRKAALNDILVRRTRTDIRKMYGDDAELLRFPTVIGPHKLEYKMDDTLQQLFYDTTEAICQQQDEGEAPVPFDPSKHIGFFRYAAITQFVDKKNTDLYQSGNRTVDGITKRLKKIMQIHLVKRLESSLAAFKTSLENLQRYNDVMIEMLRHDCVYICPDLHINNLYADAGGDFNTFSATVDALIAKKGGKNRKFKAADFKPEYLDKLLNDRRLIEQLLRRWRANDYDPKFDCFKEELKPQLFSAKINAPSGKNKQRLVIFTEALDTQESIKRALQAKGYKVLSISAKNRAEMQETIAANFDANYPADKQREDYNVIVTTEVLAEGVNLHRANVILNYDAPWNATRLMQRIGRVNRIGSPEQYVHVFNFFPSSEGNSQIRLIEKAYAKLQSFHEMFGEDNKVFSEREELTEHDLQKFADGEESPFGPFINELKEYRDLNTARYKYLMAKSAENLGGKIGGAEGTGSVFVFTDNSGGYISVDVPADGSAGKPRIISSLATMQALKCDTDATFATEAPEYDAAVSTALRTYNDHVAHFITAHDTRGEVNKAKGIIHNLRNSAELTKETRKLLKEINDAVEAKNSTVIKQVLRLDQPTLFGTEYDLNAILQTYFARVAVVAKQKRGQASVAIYEIK